MNRSLLAVAALFTALATPAVAANDCREEISRASDLTTTMLAAKVVEKVHKYTEELLANPTKATAYAWIAAATVAAEIVTKRPPNAPSDFIASWASGQAEKMLTWAVDAKRKIATIMLLNEDERKAAFTLYAFENIFEKTPPLLAAEVIIKAALSSCNDTKP